MKPVAFKNNAGAMGFRELFRVAGSPGVGLFACALKLFRLIGPDKDGYGLQSFGDTLNRTSLDAVPRRLAKVTDNYRGKVEKLGFVPGFAYSLETYGMQEAHGLVFRHTDMLSAISVVYARCVRGAMETETTTFGLCTMLMDNTYIMTSGNKRLMNKPDTFLPEYMPGASPKQAYERHMERVQSAHEAPRKIRDDDDLERLVLNCENEETEFNIDRGVFVKMTRAEMEMGTELRQEYEEQETSPRLARRRSDDDDED